MLNLVVINILFIITVNVLDNVTLTWLFQGELTRVRHDVISFEKQNEVLNEKCREVGRSLSASHQVGLW